MILFLSLMTESAHHCAFFQRLQMIHFFTFSTRILTILILVITQLLTHLINSIRLAYLRFSGSDLSSWSNSANLPGRKNTWSK